MASHVGSFSLSPCPHLTILDSLQARCALLAAHGVELLAGPALGTNFPCPRCQSEWESSSPPTLEAMPASLRGYLPHSTQVQERHPVTCIHGGEWLGGGCCGHPPYWACALHGEATAARCGVCPDWTPVLP